jgi:hypothetical protein
MINIWKIKRLSSAKEPARTLDIYNKRTIGLSAIDVIDRVNVNSNPKNTKGSKNKSNKKN